MFVIAAASLAAGRLNVAELDSESGAETVGDDGLLLGRSKPVQ